jgi:hypothetical protein
MTHCDILLWPTVISRWRKVSDFILRESPEGSSMDAVRAALDRVGFVDDKVVRPIPAPFQSGAARRFHHKVGRPI